jgi:hypothetical protein
MTTKYTFAATALAVALLAASPAAFAQSKKELAAKVVQLRQPAIEGMARSIAGQPAQTAMSAAAQLMPMVPADKREALGKQVQADVKAFYDETQAKLRDAGAKNAAAVWGPILEEKFSEDELKQIIAWLESPASKKYEQVEPEMQNQLMRKMVEDTKASVEPKLKALEQTLKKRFAPFAPPAASAPAGTAPAASAAKPPAKK